jgi:hypothetical protein
MFTKWSQIRDEHINRIGRTVTAVAMPGPVGETSNLRRHPG